MPQQRDQRLSALINKFCVRYHVHSESSYAETEALAQLWVPQPVDGSDCLTTQGAPFAIMAGRSSDQLAMYRYYVGKYQPRCDNISDDTHCTISRVFANLPPDAAGRTPSSSSSGPASGHLDRTAAAQLANIHSNLLLAVHDVADHDNGPQLRPVAVFELAQQEEDVEWDEAVSILYDVAQECGFWIPRLSSALALESTEFPLQCTSGSGAKSGTKLPKGVCSSNWLVAESPSVHGSSENLQQLSSRHGRQRRSSVIYTQQLKYDRMQQRDVAAMMAASGGSYTLQQQPCMQTVWESLASGGSAPHMQHPHALWDMPLPQDDFGSDSGSCTYHSGGNIVQHGGLHMSMSGGASQLLQQQQQQQQQHWSMPQQQPQQPWSMPQQQQQLQHDFIPFTAEMAGLQQQWWQQQQEQMAWETLQLPMRQLSMGAISGQSMTLPAVSGHGHSMTLPSLAHTHSMGMPSLATRGLSEISSAAGDGSAAVERVRALVKMGGCFRRSGASGAWEYVGGAQKVVSLSRSAGFPEVLEVLLSKAGPECVGANHIQLKYALPGSAGSLIDVTIEEDVRSMWEELDDYNCSAHTAARLQLFVGPTSGSDENSSSGGSGSSDSRSRAYLARMNSMHNKGIFHLHASNPGSTSTSNSSNAADAAVVLSLQPSGITVPSQGSDAADADVMDAEAAAAAAAGMQLLPLQADRMGSPQLLGFASDPAPGQQWSRYASAADAGNIAHSTSDQFVACRDVTASPDGEGGVSGAAAVLAAIAAKESAGKSVARAVSSANSGSLSLQQQQQEPPGGSVSVSSGVQLSASKKDPELKELVKQLQSQVEVIMPQELKVVRCIGSGAFGEVYCCRWHGTEVAVKCLAPSVLGCSIGSASSSSSAAGSKAAAELMREAAMLARLHHPNIVSVFGVVLPPRDMVSLSLQFDGGSEGDEGCSWQLGASNTPGDHVCGPAIVCEYMAAGSLQSAIRANADWLKGGMAKTKVMLDTARGLSYLHSKNMVHFDLKSGNLLFTIKDRTPTVKVADFGLSKRRHQTYVTGVDSMRGTLPWIAPEIIKNPGNVTEAADVYSYGVIMWELWTAKEPFEGVHLHALLHQLTTQGGLSLPVPGSPEWGDEAVPAEPAPGWSKLMQRCWSSDPAARPNSRQLIDECEQMMAALRRSKN